MDYSAKRRHGQSTRGYGVVGAKLPFAGSVQFRYLGNGIEQFSDIIVSDRGPRGFADMGRIGLAIILASIAAYAADQRFNYGRYTDSTTTVLRHGRHALGW